LHRGSLTFLTIIAWLGFDVVTFVEPFYASGCIHHAALSGKERMTIAADFNFQLFFCGAGSELVAAGTYHYGVSIIFRMNFLFHSFSCYKR
jgi:hypothetical protein